jgi:hypothetical protein
MSFGKKPSVASKAKEVANFAALSSIAREYRLGHEALSDLAYKGENLIRKVNPFILRATDESGNFYKTWKALSARRSAKMWYMENMYVNLGFETKRYIDAEKTKNALIRDKRQRPHRKVRYLCKMQSEMPHSTRGNPS